MRRQDVEERRLQHALGLIERHAKGGACAAVVAGDEEFIEAERPHHVDLILRHAPERVVRMIRLAARLRAVAVAPQIGRNDGEIARQARRNALPGEMGERVAVKQQERRTFAAAAPDDRYFRVRGLDAERGEVGGCRHKRYSE
jgi:hypothetical protein